MRKSIPGEKHLVRDARKKRKSRVFAESDEMSNQSNDSKRPSTKKKNQEIMIDMKDIPTLIELDSNDSNTAKSTCDKENQSYNIYDNTNFQTLSQLSGNCIDISSLIPTLDELILQPSNSRKEDKAKTQKIFSSENIKKEFFASQSIKKRYKLL